MRPFRTVLLVGLLVNSACASARGSAQELDWRAVDAAMGRSGSMQDGGVYRFGMPRSDLHVTAEGVSVRPSFALGSWLAFKQSGPNEAVAMGDLVLTEGELNRVIARLQQDGIGQTPIHKHLLEMSPAIWWMHVHARGHPVEIAQTVREALALTGTPALTDEEPRLFFMHFWANDDALELARGLRAALDQTNSRRGAAR